MWKQGEEFIAGLDLRDSGRNKTKKKTIVNLVAYLVSLETTGTADERVIAANAKADAIFHEILKTHSYAIDGYIGGSKLCRQDLVDKINGLDEVALPQATAAVKAQLVADLLPV